MDEKTKTIIDRARALLAAATPGPWEVCPDTRPDVRTTCNTGGFLGCGHIATVSRYDANEADAALIAAAPGLLATLCDALERSRFAMEWWAADCAIGVEALREAWAVMDSMARAAGVVGAFLEQAAPLLRPDASGNVKAPNYVTATFTDGVQPYEVTIRREGGKTPADIIGEITARAEAAERRAEEAEAQAAALRDALNDVLAGEWYVYDPENGFEWCGAEGSAQACATAALEHFRDQSPEGWHEDTGAIQFGLTLAMEQVEEVDREYVDRDENPSSEFDYTCNYVLKPTPAALAIRAALSSDSGRALLDRLHAAEAKVARLETRTAVLCDCVSCCSGHVAPDIEDACPDCHGSGAVIVEGGE